MQETNLVDYFKELQQAQKYMKSILYFYFSFISLHSKLSLVIWRDRLFQKLKDRIVRAAIEQVTRDRDSEQVNVSEIYGVVQSYGIVSFYSSMFLITCFLVTLGSINKTKPLEIYKEDFEAHFLASTREYYGRESTNYIAQNGVSSYMKKVFLCFKKDILTYCKRLKQELKKK